LVVKQKAFSFNWQRCDGRDDCVRENRKQLVGLKTTLNLKPLFQKGRKLYQDPARNTYGDGRACDL